MLNIATIVNTLINDQKLIKCILTSQRNKSITPYIKIVIRPIMSKKGIVYQFEKFTDKQAFHENVEKDLVTDKIINLIENEYKNTNIFSVDADYQVMVSKKGKIRILEKPPTKEYNISPHDMKKNYIIEENKPCDFLIELGIMNANGNVVKKKYDKFRQINRFLEILDDIIKNDELKDDFKIIDFGCGKAYLTFALYYYFKVIKNININIVGLDLKEDVIKFCQITAKKLNYTKLTFKVGDIQNYNYNNDIDMVVTLHACDTATDAAILKAIKWNAKYILSVPCCQHELLKKINNEYLKPMLKYGLIKERTSSLVTDTLRALYLEKEGYNVQLLEFIALEYTPKNILIRAVKTDEINKEAQNEYDKFKDFWQLRDLFIEKNKLLLLR